jgi:hypothetical protein
MGSAAGVGGGAGGLLREGVLKGPAAPVGGTPPAGTTSPPEAVLRAAAGTNQRGTAAVGSSGDCWRKTLAATTALRLLLAPGGPSGSPWSSSSSPAATATATAAGAVGGCVAAGLLGMCGGGAWRGVGGGVRGRLSLAAPTADPPCAAAAAPAAGLCVCLTTRCLPTGTGQPAERLASSQDV